MTIGSRYTFKLLHIIKTENGHEQDKVRGSHEMHSEHKTVGTANNICLCKSDGFKFQLPSLPEASGGQDVSPIYKQVLEIINTNILHWC